MTALHHIDTVVIGAGHAGLAVSRLLTLAGREHLVLDRGRVGERWRTERWDSLRLLTPTWMTRLPGWHAEGDPDGFLPAGHFVDQLEQYAASFHAPVVTGATVTCLTTGPTGTYTRAHRPRHVAGTLGRRGHRPSRQAPDTRFDRAHRRTRDHQQPVPKPLATWMREASWSWVPRPRGCRSPTSSHDRAETSSWRSDGTPGCPAATAGWTSSGGSRPPAGSHAPSTRCLTRRPPVANPRCS